MDILGPSNFLGNIHNKQNIHDPSLTLQGLHTG
jgi:hypothetical protein